MIKSDEDQAAEVASKLKGLEKCDWCFRYVDPDTLKPMGKAFRPSGRQVKFCKDCTSAEER